MKREYAHTYTIRRVVPSPYVGIIISSNVEGK